MSAKVAPVVTGISPREGPPGTRVTIRGENFGESAADLQNLAICGKNCTMTAEWISPSKIVCRTSFSPPGPGDIVVFTKSGGMGMSTVKFNSTAAKPVGPNEESLTWVDESVYVDKRLDRSQKTHSHTRTDPLGILLEDTSDPDEPSKYSHMFPSRSSFDPTDENFVPTWFLLEKHRKTSFQKLKEGHAYMKRRANKQSNNIPIQHVKDSLPVFFEVHDTLSAIHHKMQEDLSIKGKENITDEVEQLLTESSENANDLFKTVLTCKDRADSIRNTLNVLQRFKFLFHLPLQMNRNIQRGEYGVVINDYEKAKSLFQHTDVPVFQKVFKVVEEKIESFRHQLTEEVQQLPLSLTRQKTLIRYLITLEEGTNSDPAWQTLHNQHVWIQKELTNCKDKYIAMTKDISDKEEDKEKYINICAAYYSELGEIACTQLPEHWLLWQQYSSGAILSETGEKSAQVEKLKSFASRHTREMKSLFGDTMIQLVMLLRSVFIPCSLDEDFGEMFGVWPHINHLNASALSDCIRSCRETQQNLFTLNLPMGLLDPLKTFIQDARLLCLQTFLNETTQEISKLESKENWELENGGVTQLPSMYESIVTRMFMLMSDVFNSLPNEDEIFQNHRFKENFPQLIIKLFSSFAETIEKACFSSVKKDDSFIHANKMSRHLIISLNNLDHWNKMIVPNLMNKIKKYKLPNMQQITNAVESSIMTSREKLFTSYCDIKIEPLASVIENKMYEGNFTWEDCSHVEGVRPYIKFSLMKIITIHAEVFSIAPNLITSVLTEATRHLAEEICRQMEIVDNNFHPRGGALQARVDVECLMECLTAYSNEESRSFFNKALSFIPNSNIDNEKLKKYKEEFKSGMIFQQRCLQI